MISPRMLAPTLRFRHAAVAVAVAAAVAAGSPATEAWARQAPAQTQAPAQAQPQAQPQTQPQPQAQAQPQTQPQPQAQTQAAEVVRQSMDDAWWTGPMLANTPATAVPGHFLLETYVYDVATAGHFDDRGALHGAPRADGYGSLTYLIYGVAEGFSLGLVPTGGFNTVAGGLSSAGPRLGDLNVLAQFRLRQFHPGSWLPAAAFNIQQTVPTGLYDRLGNRPSDGLGSGAYTTMLSLYSQSYFWLPNGRILRMRLDLSGGFSNHPAVDGVSVYGTAPGFHGDATPGSFFAADAAWEYSLTRSWVLASDLVYRHNGNTQVSGSQPVSGLSGGLGGMPQPFAANSGSSDSWAIAPAVEYSWRPDLGVLLGLRVIAGGRNAAFTLTPAFAINYVH